MLELQIIIIITAERKCITNGIKEFSKHRLKKRVGNFAPQDKAKKCSSVYIDAGADERSEGGRHGIYVSRPDSRNKWNLNQQSSGVNCLCRPRR